MGFSKKFLDINFIVNYYKEYGLNDFKKFLNESDCFMFMDKYSHKIYNAIINGKDDTAIKIIKSFIKKYKYIK